MLRFLFILILISTSLSMMGQNLTIDGYVYESGNRGFLNVVNVEIQDENGQLLGSTFSDLTGHFVIQVPVKDNYKVQTSKDMFDVLETSVSAIGKEEGDKVFMKIEMKRSPGYIFEITLAENREDEAIPVDAIKGARIEVFNNTTGKEILNLVEHPEPHFDVALLKGNHYTILVRKDGYISKRMEAFVDVEGCILCFEGIGSVGPGVSDNLSEGNEMGVLLANVELDKIYEGKTLPINNIIYEYTSAELDRKDEAGLMALATLMKDNPDLTVEIGSHTDSRGKEIKNLELSQARAMNVIDFLIDHDVDKSRLFPKGYGETQLKNKCKSFVECTEAEHRINRRTELKVLGVAAIKSPIKTLVQIKQMENAEKLLEEIQFGGQMRIPDLPDSTQIESKIDNALDGATLNDKTEKVSEEEVHLEIPAETETAANDGMMKNSDEEVPELEIPSDTETENVEMKSDSEGELTPEMDSDQKTQNTAMAYTISISSSLESLSEEDELFSRHSNLEVRRQEDMYHYTLGHFTNKIEAETFFRTVKLAYPDAKMLTLQDDKIVK